MYGARTAKIRRNRDRLAGSSVSIVGFYDGILTVHLAFSHDDTTRRYGAPRLRVREKEREEEEEREKGRKERGL